MLLALHYLFGSLGVLVKDACCLAALCPGFMICLRYVIHKTGQVVR